MKTIYLHGWYRLVTNDYRGKHYHYFNVGIALCEPKITAIAADHGSGWQVQFVEKAPRREQACPACLEAKGLGSQLTFGDIYD